MIKILPSPIDRTFAISLGFATQGGCDIFSGDTSLGDKKPF
jgi:hypothetical protein